MVVVHLIESKVAWANQGYPRGCRERHGDLIFDRLEKRPPGGVSQSDRRRRTECQEIRCGRARRRNLQGLDQIMRIAFQTRLDLLPVATIPVEPEPVLHS